MRILVLCTGNSCRSQMAEGFFRHFLNKTDIVRSAGLTPKGVHPLAIEVMREIGIDISEQTSDSIEKYLTEQFDYVITVCDNAAEQCPVFPGDAKRIHWPFEDPAHFIGTDDEIKNGFRKVRDQIGSRIEDWVRYSE